jgi:2-hydroxychromene-2-carboxylate isomerase
MARQIDYYFSLQSPWAYIGHALLKMSRPGTN